MVTTSTRQVDGFLVDQSRHARRFVFKQRTSLVDDVFGSSKGHNQVSVMEKGGEWLAAAVVVVVAMRIEDVEDWRIGGV